jgi:hypothetical protein
MMPKDMMMTAQKHKYHVDQKVKNENYVVGQKTNNGQIRVP